MKRFINYRSNNGKLYEICATVMPTNGSYKLTIKFENLSQNEVFNFVSECAETDFFCVLNSVCLPYEGVSYISCAYNIESELIRVVPKEGEEKSE